VPRNPGKIEEKSSIQHFTLSRYTAAAPIGILAY
jgi:hypothetical protein